MTDENKYQFKMDAMTTVHATIRISAQGRERSMTIVEEDILPALLQLGDREYLGPVTMRLRQPVFGEGKLAGWRMDNLLVEAEPRTVSLMFIGEEPMPISVDRQKFCRWLREALKEIARVKDKENK
ncbi:TPA: hypothetical protein ACTPQ1_004683 [Salmonella enterica]